MWAHGQAWHVEGAQLPNASGITEAGVHAKTKNQRNVLTSLPAEVGIQPAGQWTTTVSGCWDGCSVSVVFAIVLSPRSLGRKRCPVKDSSADRSV